jgi:hypothetical protein
LVKRLLVSHVRRVEVHGVERSDDLHGTTWARLHRELEGGEPDDVQFARHGEIVVIEDRNELRPTSRRFERLTDPIG